MKLKIICPECYNDMESIIDLEFVNDCFHLMEFEGIPFKCQHCGHELEITSIEPKDENYQYIYTVK